MVWKEKKGSHKDGKRLSLDCSVQVRGQFCFCVEIVIMPFDLHLCPFFFFLSLFLPFVRKKARQKFSCSKALNTPLLSIYAWLSNKVRICTGADMQYTTNLSNIFIVIFVCMNLAFLKIVQRQYSRHSEKKIMLKFLTKQVSLNNNI